MSKLSEEDIDIILYIFDIWINANDGHRLAEKVEELSDKLSRCSTVQIKM